MEYNPIICAIDHSDFKQAKHLITEVKDHIGAVKLGLEFFVANGPEKIKEIAALGLPIFLDLKFHDIPHTVAQAVKAAVSLDVFMITVHTSGGFEMIKAAVDSAKHEAELLEKFSPLIIGVTVLTSLEQDDLDNLGVKNKLVDQVIALAKLASLAGLDGVVCSAKEVAALRSVMPADFKLIVPGIRSHHEDANDQKRTLSPHDAMQAGADFLVIGRPITKAADPKIAAMSIEQQL